MIVQKETKDCLRGKLVSLWSRQRGQISVKAAQTWDSPRSRGVSNFGCHTGKHHHLGSANSSAGFPKSWVGFQSKYTVVGRKGEGVWVAGSSSVLEAVRFFWETPLCPGFVSGSRWTVIRQVLVTLC